MKKVQQIITNMGVTDAKEELIEAVMKKVTGHIDQSRAEGQSLKEELYDPFNVEPQVYFYQLHLKNWSRKQKSL